MKIQIKTDEVDKDTKNYLKFRKRLRKMLMQRKKNRLIKYEIDEAITTFEDFDPLLDWDFHPVCSYELRGMEKLYYDLKHNSLFGKNGHLLYSETFSGITGSVCVCEGYELWLLDDMSLVFTYYCNVEHPETNASMIYRYPLGKKIPVNMEFDAEEFLEKLGDEIFSMRCTPIQNNNDC